MYEAMVDHHWRSPRLPTVCLLRACRLRPCKRVTRSINPLGAARAVNNVAATVVCLRFVGTGVTCIQFGQMAESELSL